MRKCNIILLSLIFITTFTKCKIEKNLTNNNDTFKPTHICWINGLRIRNKPSLESNIVDTLNINDEIIKIDDNESRKIEDNIMTWQEITLAGITMRAPFIHIKTKKGIIGWVYKGGLSEIVYIDNLKIFGVKNAINIFSVKENKSILKEMISTHIKTPLHDNDYKYIASIQCKFEKPFLIIMPSPFYDPVFYYIGIFDVIKNKWIGKIYGFNMFYGLSPSKKYAYVDFGTKSIFRQSALYSIEEKKIVFEFKPYSTATWSKDDSLIFKTKITVPGKSKTKINIEKVIWKNKNLIRTGKIEEVVVK